MQAMMRYLGTTVALWICTAGVLQPMYGGEPQPARREHPSGKRKHVVQQLNGEGEPTGLPAEIQWISEPWQKAKPDENAQMPYLAYLPEIDRVLMLVETQQPIRTAFLVSDERRSEGAAVVGR